MTRQDQSIQFRHRMAASGDGRAKRAAGTTHTRVGSERAGLPLFESKALVA